MRALALAGVLLCSSALAAAPTWRWLPTSEGFPRAAVTAKDAQGAIHLRAPRTGEGAWTLTAGAWRQMFTPTGPTGRFVGAALAADAETIYLASFYRIATGCALRAFDRATGAERWQVQLEGAGPVRHSRYHNRVRLEIIDGRPTAFGWETQARYIEARDPRTGALVHHQRLPPKR